MPMLAVIRAHATHSQEPQWFTTAPIPAIRKLLDRAGWEARDVDLYRDQRGVRRRRHGGAEGARPCRASRLNVNGGACALGHPIGATGARLIVTLLHALEQPGRQARRRLACIGGGEATAIAIERL